MNGDHENETTHHVTNTVDAIENVIQPNEPENLIVEAVDEVEAASPIAALQRTIEALKQERDAALERQAATAEVLRVINAHPGDLAPVFQIMLDKTMALCGAAFGEMVTYDGTRLQTVAVKGMPAAYAEYRRQHGFTSGPGTLSRRLLDGEDVIHTGDAKAGAAYQAGDPSRRALVDLGGARTVATVAMRSEGKLLGAINIYRQEVKPFDDRQISILQNFAAQAVMAMENARLITEQREALEQQTAISEVLRVINTSAGTLTPVLETVVDQATKLCDAPIGIFWLTDGSVLQPAAWRGFTPEFLDALKALPAISTPGLRAVSAGAPFHHILDVKDPEQYPKGIKVSDAEMMTLNIEGDAFHPEWNYTISPRLSD